MMPAGTRRSTTARSKARMAKFVCRLSPSSHPSNQVRVYRAPVGGIGGHHKFPLPQAQQIVLPHGPQHALVIHDDTLGPQVCRYTSISVIAVLQGDSLNPVPQLRFCLPRRMLVEIPVVAGATHLGSAASVLDR